MKTNTAPKAVLDPKTPDTQLAELVATGDEAAMRLLMKRYNQKLYRTARSILKDDHEAEDALQDAYIKAIRSIGSYRGEAKLSTWLVRVVANEALQRLRKTRRGAEIVTLEGDTHALPIPETQLNVQTDSQPELEALRSEARRILERKIDELPEAFRTVFMLRAVEEMTVEEVAVSLGIPEATVRTRLFRARALIRAALSQEMDLALEGAFSFLGARCDRIVESVIARLQRS